MTTTQEPTNVIGLTQRGRYKPDLGALARSQVQSARTKLGLSHREFADVLAPLLGWHPTGDIVASWESQATPPGDVILAAGLAAQATPREILPVALSVGAEKVIDLLSSFVGDLERIAGSPDVQRAYAMRGLIARPEWNQAISGSTDTLWLYGMAEMGYAVDDQVPGILQQAAQAGCEIRVLLLHPDYPGLPDIDLDEGNPVGTLGPRIRAALARFGAMRAKCGDRMHIRLYNSPPTVSIVRGDSRMLVTPYMRFFVGGNSPTFDLHRVDGNVFDRYTRHFEYTWNLSEEWAA